MSSWRITRYSKSWNNAFQEISVEWCFKNRWAVRCKGHCLNKKGVWEYEPLPSNRTEAFLKRCRFDTAEQARKAADKDGPIL
jgi:hypothetical protein